MMTIDGKKKFSIFVMDDQTEFLKGIVNFLRLDGWVNVSLDDINSQGNEYGLYLLPCQSVEETEKVIDEISKGGTEPIDIFSLDIDMGEGKESGGFDIWSLIRYTWWGGTPEATCVFLYSRKPDIVRALKSVYNHPKSEPRVLVFSEEVVKNGKQLYTLSELIETHLKKLRRRYCIGWNKEQIDESLNKIEEAITQEETAELSKKLKTLLNVQSPNDPKWNLGNYYPNHANLIIRVCNDKNKSELLRNLLALKKEIFSGSWSFGQLYRNLIQFILEDVENPPLHDSNSDCICRQENRITTIRHLYNNNHIEKCKEQFFGRNNEIIRKYLSFVSDRLFRYESNPIITETCKKPGEFFQFIVVQTNELVKKVKGYKGELGAFSDEKYFIRNFPILFEDLEKVESIIEANINLGDKMKSIFTGEFKCPLNDPKIRIPTQRYLILSFHGLLKGSKKLNLTNVKGACNLYPTRIEWNSLSGLRAVVCGYYGGIIVTGYNAGGKANEVAVTIDNIADDTTREISGEENEAFYFIYFPSIRFDGYPKF